MNYSTNAAGIIAVLVVALFLVVGMSKISDNRTQKIETVTEERNQELRALGNPHTDKGYFPELSPRDMSYQYDLVCIHGMPYLKSRLTGGEIYPIPPYSWKLLDWAWRSCSPLYEE